MKRTVYLHMGVSKTGTTAIQAMCYKNRDKLLKDGIYYPIDYSYQPGEVFSCHNGNIGTLFTGGKSSLKEMVQKICASTKNYEVSLISTESMWFEILDKKEFLDLFAEIAPDVKIKVIVYIRRQDDYIESLYREFVKSSNFERHIDELLDIIVHESDEEVCKREKNGVCEYILNSAHYYRQLMDIVDSIGKENLICRIYDRRILKEGDICEDFFEILGVSDIKKYDNVATVINPSLDCSTLEVKRIMNAIYNTRNVCNSKLIKMALLNNVVTKRNKEKIIGLESIFNIKQKQIIEEYFEKENKLLFEQFFNGQQYHTFFNYEEGKQDKKEIKQEELLYDTIRVMCDALLQVESKLSKERQRYNELNNYVQRLEKRIELLESKQN